MISPTKLLLLTAVLLLIVAAFVAGRFTGRRVPETPAGTYHAGLTIDRITELAELLVIQLDVTDVVITSLQGRTGGVQIVLLVKGDVVLGIDMAAARLQDVDNAKRTAVLHLPRPTASRPRLDHTRTRIVLLRKEGLWQLSIAPHSYAAVADRAMGEAQTLVNAAGSSADAERRARAHAEQVLRTFFRSIEWSVQICWLDTEPALDPGMQY
jgi:hypothetical protein